jgi:hypothetical protein
VNHAFDYCKTPARVTKRELINALHQSLLQIQAHEKLTACGDASCLDDKPCISEATRLLAKAGHIGFTK